REVVDRELLLVVEDARVDGPVRRHVADDLAARPGRGPRVTAVGRLDHLDGRLGVDPEEAQLGAVEGVVPRAVHDRWVPAGAEVAGLLEAGGLEPAAPGVAAVVRGSDPQ